MGRPYGTDFQLGSTSSIGYMIDQTDASVAPPRLTSLAPGHVSRNRFRSATGIQSPLIRIALRLSKPVVARADASIRSTKVGTVFQSVISYSFTQFTRDSGS